jgi:hypothetical protein
MLPGESAGGYSLPMQPDDTTPEDDVERTGGPMASHRFSRDVKVVEVRRSGHVDDAAEPDARGLKVADSVATDGAGNGRRGQQQRR